MSISQRFQLIFYTPCFPSLVHIKKEGYQAKKVPETQDVYQKNSRDHEILNSHFNANARAFVTLSFSRGFDSAAALTCAAAQMKGLAL